MYFSEELYNASKYGYKFEILWGYTFQKDFTFKEYVDDLYKLRLTYPKSDPMNMIAKLLLNSLYGRFGMDDNFVSTKIVNSKDYSNFETRNLDSIINVLPMEDNYIVQFKDPQKEMDNDLDNSSRTHNINIAIASAVTAYARIHMSQFKNNHSLPNLYYSDTDSVYFDGPLPKEFISNTNLGKLKLEGIYAVFLAPKVCALQNMEGLIIKIKGLSKESVYQNKIDINMFKELLVKKSNFKILQDKWFKHLNQGNISILEQLYTLQVTSNKRELIYNDNNILVKTRPITLNNGEIVTPTTSTSLGTPPNYYFYGCNNRSGLWNSNFTFIIY